MKLQKKYLTVLVLGAAMSAGYFLANAAPVFDPSTQPIGYVSMNALSGNGVGSGTEKLFSVEYDNSDWSGNLHSYSISAGGAISATDDWTDGTTTPKFGVQDKLDALTPTARNIATLGKTSPQAFTDSNNLCTVTTVNPKPVMVGTTPATCNAIVNYVRGDTANVKPNGLNYRARAHKLGDIIHSTPVYSVDDNGLKTVFVGANDGMLHAFNADPASAEYGNERWAYVPAAILPKLGGLTVDPYVHKYFVDGRLAVRKVTKNSVTKTILVGTLGGGGKGLFAIDVSDANLTGATLPGKVLWDITESGGYFAASATGAATSVFNDNTYAELGHTYAAPAIVMLQPPASSSSPTPFPVVVVGNGYNNVTPGTGKAALYVIDAFNGFPISIMMTGDGAVGSSPAANGLSTASLADTNADGYVDKAYAGDIDGKLWEFDLSSIIPTGKNGLTGTKLFTTNPAQAITSAPSIMRHPVGGLMVTFTTGRMLVASDAGDTATHYAYGIWTQAPVTNTTLLGQTLLEVTYTGVTPALRGRKVSSTVPNWTAGNHKGWKTPLPIGGERLVGDGSYISDGVYLFSTTNPTIKTVGSLDGENWYMQLNALTGGGFTKPRIDMNSDAQFNTADNLSDGANPAGVMLGSGVRSQAVELNVGSFSVFSSNKDNNKPPAPTPSGVDGGHFDVDRFDGTPTNKSAPAVPGYVVPVAKHTHEYDDKFQVTGVNFLNPSEALANISYNIDGTNFTTSTDFKVLVMNQAWSPAVALQLGSGGYINVLELPWARAATAADVLVQAPIYNYSNVTNFQFNMPIDTFSTQDWAKTGDFRAGLLPTVPGCVKDANKMGPLGEWRDGALTFQVIRANTKADQIEMNVPGRPDLGWRLKPTQDNMTNYWLVEYSTYWHEDANICYGNTGWRKNPPLDMAPGSQGTAAPGANDPKTFIQPITGCALTNTCPTPTPTPPPGKCVPGNGVVCGSSSDQGRVNWRELRQ